MLLEIMQLALRSSILQLCCMVFFCYFLLVSCVSFVSIDRGMTVNTLYFKYVGIFISMLMVFCGKSQDS